MVGQVEWVNAELLRAVMDAGTVPVIAPIARDPRRWEAQHQRRLGRRPRGRGAAAEKIVLVSATPTASARTPRRTRDDTADSLTKSEIDGLIESGVIAGGHAAQGRGGV